MYSRDRSPQKKKKLFVIWITYCFVVDNVCNSLLVVLLTSMVSS